MDQQPDREFGCNEITGKRADHVDVAVGEVDQPENAVHHRVAESNQGIDRADIESIDQLLNKGIHRRLFAYFVGEAAPDVAGVGEPA